MADSHFVSVERKVDARQVVLEMHLAIMDQIGNPIVLNTCMLGALIGLTNMIRIESILKILETSIPVDFLDMNKKAFTIGLNLAEKYIELQPSHFFSPSEKHDT